MQRKILLAVTVLVCLGLCLGGLAAKNKVTTVQANIDRADLIAGLASRDNVQVLAKAELLVGMARNLIAEGQSSRAIDLLHQVSLMDLPATRAGQKILVDTNLALGDFYSQLPAEGLHKSIHFYGRALEQMDISQDADLMVSTLNTAAAIQTVLGNVLEAGQLQEAARNVRIGIVPAPLNQLPNVSATDDPGDDNCGDSVAVTLDHTEVMTVSTSGDHNWRDFSLSAPTVVLIETQSLDTFGDDTDLTLYGGCSGTTPTEFIEFDDDDGPGFLSRIELCLPAGDFWVEVGGFGNSSTPDDFDLNITAGAPCVIPEPDEYEPDNESSLASKIGFRNNGVGHGNQGGRDNSQIQAHSIFPGGDIDFVEFGLSRANFVRIETTGGDTVIGLSNSGGALLASDDDGGEGLASKLELCLPPADWLVVAIGFSASAELSYDIAVDVEHPCLFEDEPNATCDLTGDEIMPGEIWSGMQTAAGVAENDYYFFTVEEEAFYSIATSGWDDFAVDTFLELYDGCPGTLIASDDDGGPGFLSEIGAVLAPGTYYVNATVSPFSVGSNYPYSLSIEVAEAPTVETEPNNSCGTANAAALGDSFGASIGVAGDRDNFLLTVPADGFVSIGTTGPSGDTVLQVQNADGSVVVGCDDDGGDGLFSLFACCLEAGQYCVTVMDFGDNSTIASYDIEFIDGGSCTPSGSCPSAGLGCPF